MEKNGIYEQLLAKKQMLTSPNELVERNNSLKGAHQSRRTATRTQRQERTKTHFISLMQSSIPHILYVIVETTLLKFLGLQMRFGIW